MTNKQKIIALQKKLEKLEAQRDAEVTRTRSGVAAGLTLTALGKLSVFSTRDQKVIGKYLSDYVDQSIGRFVDDKAAAKEKAAKTGLKVETKVEGNHPEYRIVDNDVAGNFIPAEQKVENILLTSYLQGVAKEGR